MAEVKITLEIKHNRSNGSFGCIITKEIDGDETKQKISETDDFSLLRSIVTVLKMNLEDMADED